MEKMQISHYSVIVKALQTRKHKQQTLLLDNNHHNNNPPQNESCREDGRSREVPYVPYHVNTLVRIGKAGKIHSTLGDPTTQCVDRKHNHRRHVVLHTPELLEAVFSNFI